MFNIPKIDFTNPAKLSGSGEIFAGAGFGKSAGLEPEPDPEPKSGTALIGMQYSVKYRKDCDEGSYASSTQA